MSGVLLLGLIALSTAMLPSSPPDDSHVVNWSRAAVRHAEALWTGRRVKPGIDIGYARDYGWIVVQQTPEGGRVIPLEEQSWDAQERILAQAINNPLFSVGYTYTRHRRGLWAPWREAWSTTVTVTYTVNKQRVDDPALCTTARSIGAGDLRRRGVVFADSVGKGGDSGVRVRWNRIAWNLGTLVCFVGFIHAAWTWKRFRGQRRWERGECPVCGYPVLAVGVVGGSRTCPECGTAARALVSDWRVDQCAEHRSGAA